MWVICQDRTRIVQVNKVEVKKKKITAPEESPLAVYDSPDRAAAVFLQLIQTVKAAAGTDHQLVIDLPQE